MKVFFSLKFWVFLSVAIFVSRTFAQTANTPKWTPQTLNGTVSLHDGPNCFNGALASKGYMDHLVYVGPSEYRYYLENFCQDVTTSPETAGQLFALNHKNGSVMHGALSLGGNRIFEKTSIAGSLGRFEVERAEASVYAIKNKNQSSYFKDGFGGEVHDIQRYSCQGPLLARNYIASVLQDSVAAKIWELRLKIEEKTSHEVLPTFADLKDSLIELASMLDQLNGGRPQDLFILVSGESLSWHLFNINEESKIDTATMAAADAFRLSLDPLARRISMKNPDAKASRILNEVLSAAYRVN